MNLSAWINSQVIQSVARWALGQLGAVLMAAGYVNAEQTAQASGAILVLLAVVTSVISARTKSAALKVIGAGSTSSGVEIVKGKIAQEIAAKR